MSLLHKPIKVPKNSYMDPLLLACEIYNPNKFPIEFHRRNEMNSYVTLSGKSPGPAFIRCEPDGHCILPHRYYVGTGVGAKPGEPVQCMVIEGKDMGRGLKTASGIGVR